MERLSSFADYPQMGTQDDKHLAGLVLRFKRPDGITGIKEYEEFQTSLECVTDKYVIMRRKYYDTTRKRTRVDYVGYLRNTAYAGQPNDGDVRVVIFDADEVKLMKREEADNPAERITKRVTIAGASGGRNTK